MNKDVKKLMGKIEEKEGRRREKLSKAEAEASATRDKLEQLEAAMTAAESAEQYKELLKEKRDLEAVLEFCEKRIKEAKGENITPEEYKAAMMETQKAFTALKEDKRAAIREEATKLMNLYYSYDTEVAELNKINQKIATLHRVNPNVFNAGTISGEDEELREFTNAFYRLKNFAEMNARYSN